MTLLDTHSTARALLDVTAFAWVASELGIRVRSSANRGGTRVDRGSVLAVVAGIGIGVLVAVRVERAVPGASMGNDWAVLGCGVGLMWVGIALRQWAVWTLGRFFTVVVQVTDEQTVVDRGPYRWARHPSYTGLLTTLLGLGLALENWLSLLALAILPTVGVVIRIRVEERALLGGLGEPYRVYAAGHRRLVPGIW